LELSERVARLRSEVSELEEARAAGDAAMRAVSRVTNALKGAEGWGQWDLWGGDLISSSIKHNHLDTAKTQAATAGSQIARFQRELADTGIRLRPISTMEVSGPDWFMDVFLDNFFTDYSIQRKIRQSNDEVEGVLGQVTAAMILLGTRLGQARAELRAAEHQRTRLLEGT
ncbi:MAG: hypothetical protein ACO1SX_14355, partial [Actinomycetota bacterium]